MSFITTMSTQQQHTELDFRDIHEHPPVDSSPVVVPDPSWDAHKVLFSEYEKAQKEKGDNFDDIFQNENVTDSDLALELLDQQQQQATRKQPRITHEDNPEAFDPLGWPQATETNFAASDEFAATFNDNDAGEEDDANLLSDNSNTEADENAFVIDHVCANVSNLCLGNDGSLLTSIREPSTQDTSMSKGERIKMYERIEHDDESSVEEPDDDDDDDDISDEGAAYEAQLSDNEEDVPEYEIPNFSLDPLLKDSTEESLTRFEETDFASFDTVNNSESLIPEKSNPKRIPQVKLKKLLGDTKDGQPKKSLLLKPPPPEKLKAWESSKAGQSPKT